MKKATKILTFLSLLCFMEGMLLAQPEEPREIRGISFQKFETQLTVFIEFPKGIAYESYSLTGPQRLVLDFMDIERISAEPSLEINSFGVLRIRVGKPEPSITRIVFDLEEKAPLHTIKDVERGLEVSFWQAEVREEKEEVKPAVEKKEEVKKPEEPPKIIKPVIKEEAKKPEEVLEREKKFSLGILTGFSIMQDEAFKEIYGKSLLCFGGEYSFTLPFKSIQSLDILLSFKYMRDKGLTTFTEEEIKLRIIDQSLALRYIRNLKRFAPFIGIGIDYILYKETYPETFPIESISGSDLGFHFQGGTYVHLTPYLSAKAHAKYIMSKTTEEEITVDLGGPEFGVSLVFRFNL